MAKTRIVPKDATREEKLKIVADHLYTNTELWIQAAIDSDRQLDEFVYRINKGVKLLLRPPQM